MSELALRAGGEIDLNDHEARERGKTFKQRLRSGFNVIKDKEGDWHGVPDVEGGTVTVKPPRNGEMWFVPTGAELALSTVDEFMFASGSIEEHAISDDELYPVQVDHLEVSFTKNSTQSLPVTVYSAWRPVEGDEIGYGIMTRRVTYTPDLSSYPLYVFPGEPDPPVPYGYYDVPPL